MAGGWIQAGLLKSLDGHGGLAAWRWLFIIVSVITIPLVAFGKYRTSIPFFSVSLTSAIIGWAVIPNLPSHKSAWYLSESERQWAIDRLGKPKKQDWDVTVLKRVFASWQFYLLPLIFMCKIAFSLVFLSESYVFVYSMR